MKTTAYDVLVIGGGPAGATASMLLARDGFSVGLIEKSPFPRFQIGESFLPRNYQLLYELGLAERFQKLPQVPKLGVEFVMGDGTPPSRFWFRDSLIDGVKEAFNIARADFDQLLLDAAREAGVNIHQPATVTSIDKLDDGGVELSTKDSRFTGRVLIDASGHGTIVARHLGTRSVLDEPHLQKVAHFAHFEHVERPPGDMEGFPAIVTCDEGWFWIIPLNAKHTSVGLVLDPAIARQIGVPPNRVLSWGIQRCPTVRQRMARAIGPDTNVVRSDFSYRCTPYAGPGYFLVGDAATFLDPIFSTGVCLGMMSAKHTAEQVGAMLKGQQTPAAARRKHTRFIRGSTDIFIRIIRKFYTHEFREMFLHGQGPLDVHWAVLGVLAGHVFPKPAWRLRWRFRLFEVLLDIHRRWGLVPRRPRFSLLKTAAVESPVTASNQMVVYGEQKAAVS